MDTCQLRLLSNLNYYHRRLRDDNCVGMSEYFNLPKNLDVNFELNIQDKSLKFFVKYRKRRYEKLAEIIKKTYIGLPIELNEVICKFIPENLYIDLEFNVNYSDTYPFEHPLWSFNSIHTNIYCNMNLAEYFKYKVETYNQHYFNCWTPAIWIDKELLLFLASINNFEYMIDYK